MGAHGESDEHVEVQVTKLIGSVVVLGACFGEDLARFEPIALCRSQNGMVLAERPQKFSFSIGGGAAPQFGQHHGGVAQQAAQILDTLPVAAGAQVVHQHGRIEDDEFTHRGSRTRACPRPFS